MKIKKDKHEIFWQQGLKARMEHDALSKVAMPVKVYYVCAHR